MIERLELTARIRQALRNNPIAALIGPRQCGKTTLVRNLVASEREFITLDDDTVLAELV